MKYVVYAYTAIVSNGSMSELNDWEFETEAEAESFFEDYDVKADFEIEVMTAGRHNCKDKKFVVWFGRYDEENEVFEVFESKECSIADLDD